MESIIWTDAYSVGVARIDEQHKKLIAMVNRLIEDQKKLTDPELIAQLLTEMMDYAQEHFRTEEHLLAEYGYERKDQHEALHQGFIEQTMAFCGATTTIGPNILSTALLEYLKTWWVEHILNKDMEYMEFFNARGVY